MRVSARSAVNRPTLDGVAQFGPSARAVVVVDRDVTDAELPTMAGRDAVGIRVNFGTPQSWGPTTAERLETMARKVAPLGWHVQIYATGDTIVELELVLSRLPTPLVIDHLARLPPDQGVNHPASAAVRRLLDGGRTWMKLSGAYLNTASGPPAYADATAVAKSFAAAAPERVVWGSDWPHRGEKHLPDDARLLDLLAERCPSDAGGSAGLRARSPAEPGADPRTLRRAGHRRVVSVNEVEIRGGVGAAIGQAA